MIFAGPGERIELAHVATDRGIFARGAVKAALWARGSPPGLYSMAMSWACEHASGTKLAIWQDS